jgi:hypothetical protein
MKISKKTCETLEKVGIGAITRREVSKLKLSFL